MLCWVDFFFFFSEFHGINKVFPKEIMPEKDFLHYCISPLVTSEFWANFEPNLVVLKSDVKIAAEKEERTLTFSEGKTVFIRESSEDFNLGT